MLHLVVCGWCWIQNFCSVKHWRISQCLWLFCKEWIPGISCQVYVSSIVFVDFSSTQNRLAIWHSSRLYTIGTTHFLLLSFLLFCSAVPHSLPVYFFFVWTIFTGRQSHSLWAHWTHHILLYEQRTYWLSLANQSEQMLARCSVSYCDVQNPVVWGM